MIDLVRVQPSDLEQALKAATAKISDLEQQLQAARESAPPSERSGDSKAIVVKTAADGKSAELLASALAELAEKKLGMWWYLLVH
jgi:hypothetical protein